MAKSKSKKSIASHSLRESAKARLAGQKPPVASQAKPKKEVAPTGQPDAQETNVAVEPAPATIPYVPADAKKPASAEPKKLSALAAAAKVLQETGGALNCPALIALMGAKGYWTSPRGKTPAATLAAAMQREITDKGDQSRFRKTGRGLYEATAVRE